MTKTEFITNINPNTGYNEYRSLYEFLSDYKGFKRVSNIYKSAFLQNEENEDDYLFIACEVYDDTSLVTDANYNRICEMIEKYETELLEFYDKKYIEMIRYSYN